MNPLVSQSARIVAELRERLKAAHDIEDGDEVLETTLEGATDLPEMLATMARRVKRIDGYAKACRDIAADNLDCAASYERQKESLRSTITWALTESGLKKIPKDAAPDLSVYTSMSDGSVEILNEDAVPELFRHPPKRGAPNKNLIRATLEAGERVNWATLSEPKPILMIKAR